MESSNVTLYFAPTSFSSQIARLALVEKHVQYTPALVDIHQSFQNLSRDYARINPALVVPTLKHGDLIVRDCHKIMQYVDESFEGPELRHANRELMEKVIGIQKSVNEVLLTFPFLSPEQTSPMLEKKLAILQGLIDEGGEFKEVRLIVNAGRKRIN